MDPGASSLNELLEQLANLRITVKVEGDQLHFSAPKGVLTPPLRTWLSGQKPALMAYFSSIEASEKANPAWLAPQPRPALLPLSYAQQSLWLIDRFDPSTRMYNLSDTFHLQGPMDVNALNRSLAAILERHESLRTNFQEVEGLPVQIIRPVVGSNATGNAENGFDGVAYEDFSTLPEENRLAQAVAWIDQIGLHAYDLSKDWLLRASLARLGPEDHLLGIAMHHIVTDGWSITNFWRELAACYQAFNAGRQPELAVLPLQYADYAIWQRKWLEGNRLPGDRLERGLDYWRTCLAGLARLDLLTDHPRPAAMNHQAGLAPFTVSLEVEHALRDLCRDEGATPFMGLLAVFAVLLMRYSGQTDIAIGVPTAGRSQVELEPLIGLFVNALAMRIDLKGAPSFRQVLQRVRQTALDALDHQDVPFDKLVDELKPERSLNINPLFQVLFQLENFPSTEPSLANLVVEKLPSGLTMFSVDLYLSLTRSTTGLKGMLTYSRELFDPGTIHTMIGQYLAILEETIVRPDQPIEDLSIFSQNERDRIQSEMAHPAPPMPLEVPGDSSNNLPISTLEAQMAIIWQEVLGIDSLGMDENFFRLGGNSLLGIRLFALLNKRLDLQLPLAALFSSPTIRQLCKAVHIEPSILPKDPLVLIQPGGPGLPLFLVHGWGGGVLDYAHLAQGLGSEDGVPTRWPVFGLQAPDRLDEQKLETLEEIASRYIQSMKTVQPHGPYRLGGYCSGGVIAYEIACQLMARGEAVSLLALIETYLPGSQLKHPKFLDPLRLALIRQNIPTWLDGIRQGGGALYPRIKKKLRRLTKKRRLTPARRFDLIYEDLYLDADTVLSETQKEILRRYNTALFNYRARPYPGKVSLFMAWRLTLHQALTFPPDPTLEWRQLAQGGVELRRVEGSHHDLHLPPHVHSLASALRTALEDIDAL